MTVAEGEVPDGLCKCGCGQEVNRDWAPGHNRRANPMGGGEHPNWEGGRYTNDAGYVLVHRPDHERSDANGYVREHLLVVEEAVGRPVPRHAEVHHVNGDPTDNRPENLVLCEDRAYHMLLEMRTRALEACGNPDWRKCAVCGEYDDPAKMASTPGKKSGRYYHRECSWSPVERKRREAT